MPKNPKEIKTALIWILGVTIYLILFYKVANGYISSSSYIDLKASNKISYADSGTNFNEEIMLTNNTVYTLASSDNYFLSYHLFNANGDLISFDNVRTPLPVIKPGRTVKTNINIDVPVNKGEYVLEADVVKEREFWFKEKGSKTIKLILVSQ